jgi:nucleotide-binding universal stress UspA family protein
VEGVFLSYWEAGWFLSLFSLWRLRLWETRNHGYDKATFYIEECLMRILLVPVSDRPESKTALKVAAGLAKRLDGNIVACHLRPHRDPDKGYKTTGLPLFGSPNREWLDELSKKSTDSAARRAEKQFDAVLAEEGFTRRRRPRFDMQGDAIWLEKVGVPDKVMAIEGPVTDMTIVTRPVAKSRVARLFLLAALMRTGRPVLILPPAQTKAPGKRIAIAWNQSPEVARVVSACMPLMQSAEEVTIISCGLENRLGPKASKLQAYLKSYGVKASITISKGKNEEAELLAAYKKSKSDLLLMGAYSRPRFREIVFGGMTQYMLSKAKIPIIMQHS